MGGEVGVVGSLSVIIRLLRCSLSRFAIIFHHHNNHTWVHASTSFISHFCYCKQLVPPLQTAAFIHPRPTHFPQAGSPHPNPTNKYNKNTITTTNNTINFTFFHHILLFNPRLRTRKSLALPPNRSVLSTNKSILSPLSNTRSIFSVIIPLTFSISLCTFRNASCCPLFVVPYSTMSFFNSLLNAAAP